MGFFFSQELRKTQQRRQSSSGGGVGKSTTSRKPSPKALQTAATLLSTPNNLTCRDCPLDTAALQHPKMPPTGAAQPVFYFYGEAPGAQEDQYGQQFIGKSGELIRDRIPSRWEKHIRWNNTARCRSVDGEGGNRAPTPLESACCRRLQEEDIATTRPAVVVAFGGVALQWLTRSAEVLSIQQWRGRRLPVRVRDHTFWVYPVVHPAAFLYMRSAKNYEQRKMYEPSLRCFERDLTRVFSEYEVGLPDPLVEDPANYREGIEIQTTWGETGLRWLEARLKTLAALPEVAIDIETNALRPYAEGAKILTCAIGTYDQTVAFALEQSYGRWTREECESAYQLLREFLLHSGRKWAHNLKFEQEWFLCRFGPEVLYDTAWGDTLAQAHAIDERRGKSLDDLTLQYFGFRLKSVSNLDGKRIDSYPLDTVLWYNGMDTKYTAPLQMLQRKVIDRLGVSTVYDRLVRRTPSLVQMQAKGVVRSLSALRQMDTTLQAERDRLKDKILTHKDVLSYQADNPKFSPTSNTELLRFFRKYSNGGLQNVDEETLLSIDHPIARLTLDLRSVIKRHSTYVVPLLDGGKNVYPDGLIHSNFNHLHTSTVRLSSDDPNLQNFPRRDNKEVRRGVGAPPGHQLVAFDYGQLEARVVAMLSGDSVLVAETRRGEDIHGVWTDKIGGRFLPKRITEPGGHKWIRDHIKNKWTFPNFFGNVVEAMAWDLSVAFGVEVPPRLLQPYYDEFWAKYGGVLRWQEQGVTFYREHGYVQNALGFRRHEPMSRNELINMPVQSTAAEIVLDGQARLAERAYREGRPSLQPIMNVHDDLTFYLPDETLERDVEDIAREMVCVPFDFINVPLAVDVSVGDNWCDKDDLHTFTTNDFR